jgi:uncharacterized protein YoxC
MKRLILLVVPVLTILPGCVVWEIRDELRTANAKLGEVDDSLTKIDRTNDSIVKTNEALDHTNKIIADVEQGLKRIDTTNSSLDGLDKQLSLLRSIESSLTRLDQHLASLRRTIGRIDSAIPFLGLGGDESPEPAAASATPDETPKTDTQTPSEPKAARGQKEPLAGIWVSQYPDQALAIIIATEGRYVRSTRTISSKESTTVTERGGWKREDAKTLRFSPDPQRGKRADGTVGEVTIPSWNLTTETQTVRSMAAVIDGKVVVLARP